MYIFITSRSVLLRMRKFSAISCMEIKTHTLCSVPLFQKSYRLWQTRKNLVERDRPQMIIWRMRTACWIAKSTLSLSLSLSLSHTHTLRIYNKYCFCKETMVTRTPFNVTLYIHYRSNSWWKLSLDVTTQRSWPILQNQATKKSLSSASRKRPDLKRESPE